MKLYGSAKVTGIASTEVTTTLLSGTASAPKHVDGLFFTEDPASNQHDATIRVYKDTVKIAEFYIAHWCDDADSNHRLAVSYVELDVALAEGEKLEVGHLSGGTLSVVIYTAKYEEGRR